MKSTIKRFLTGFVGLIILAFGVAGISAPKTAYAATVCSAGMVPNPVTLVTNGDFATGVGGADIIGHPGTNNTTPAYMYPTGFASQSIARQDGVWPSDSGSVNAFSIQTGPYDGGAAGITAPFPGDPENNVPSVNTWYYSNGNALGSGTYPPPNQSAQEYVLWDQVITGLTPGREYVFYGYVTNVLKTINVADDPVISLRVDGTPGMPDGTQVFGPYRVTEASSLTAQPLEGWQRMAYSFTASSSTIELKITDQSPGDVGDDFGLAQIGFSECTPVNADALHTVGTPIATSSNQFEVPFVAQIINDGETPMSYPQIVANLRRTFGPDPTISIKAGSLVATPIGGAGAGDCVANTAFNGLSDHRLLSGTNGVSMDPGDGCLVEYTVQLDYGANPVPTGTLSSQVHGSFTYDSPNNGATISDDPSIAPVAPANAEASDLSTDSSSFPTTPNGDTPDTTDFTLPPFDPDPTPTPAPQPGPTQTPSPEAGAAESLAGTGIGIQLLLTLGAAMIVVAVLALSWLGISKKQGLRLK